MAIKVTKETVRSGRAARKTYLKIEKDNKVVGYLQPTYLDFGYGIMSHNYIVKNMITFELQIFQTLYDVCVFLNIDSDEFCKVLPRNWETEYSSF